eukprot:SAG31_NODE_3419_length_4297_cov_1.545606_3_plen_112_part_00
MLHAAAAAGDEIAHLDPASIDLVWHRLDTNSERLHCAPVVDFTASCHRCTLLCCLTRISVDFLVNCAAENGMVDQYEFANAYRMIKDGLASGELQEVSGGGSMTDAADVKQ